jgi:UDP-2,3-diacylglucosamine hydrolase
MSILFISDIHLEESRPEALEWLRSFIAGPAHQAEAVYILGDLFEFWIGDDAPPWAARRLARATAELVETGVPCHFLHGNRDFLLGEAYAAEARLHLLPESLVVPLYGTPTLLLHGDTLCIDDVEYQAFRQQARDPAWQAAILTLPVEERLRLAREARDSSAQHTGSTAMHIMDVNETAVQEAFRRHGVNRMIHGHTHRPAVHTHDLGDGAVGERIVLADWYSGGSFLEVTPEGSRTVTL